MVGSLEALHDKEAVLLAAISDSGTFEDRAAVFETSQIPEQWLQVLKDYVRLLAQPQDRKEALRRAVFLVWYWWNEPWQLTGMRDRDSAIELAVLQALEEEMHAPEPDRELLAMLGAYGDGLPFDQHPEFTATLSFVRTTNGVDALVPFRNLETRGSMGAYWLSRNGRPR